MPMTSESEIERVSSMIASPGVFPTALLVWIDEESGEALEIEVHGEAAGAWIDDLLTQGFVVLEPPAEDAPRRRCRIEVSRSGN